MTDWTIIATTLGAAAVTGAVGYGSARWQGKVGMAQAHEETERLRVQHREDHLRNRQTTYHLFLDEVVTLDRMRSMTHAVFGEGVTAEAWAEALEALRMKFFHLLNGVRLFGTSEVRAAADRLNELFNTIMAEWWTALADAPEADRRLPGRVFPRERLTDWDAALDALIDAMRADVAPT
jgi:hypothetical protein